MVTQEPDLADQLNSIIEYLNYHGHLFLRVTSDKPDDEKGVIFSPSAEIG